MDLGTKLWLDYKNKYDHHWELAFEAHIKGDRQTELEHLRKAAGAKMMMEGAEKFVKK